MAWYCPNGNHWVQQLPMVEHVVNHCTVGGQKNLPFMHFENKAPNHPVVAIEIKDRRPDDWSAFLLEAWGDAVNDPAKWAKAAEAAGADLIQLTLSLKDLGWQSNHPRSCGESG